MILAFALSGPVVDLIVRRAGHPAYFWGVGAILGEQLVIGPLGFSPGRGSAAPYPDGVTDRGA